MILRRLTQHVRDQNWTAVAIDFVIVVVGVFLGIQVSNWNGERALRAQERDLLTRMRIEASDASAEMAAYREQHAFILDGAVRLAVRLGSASCLPMDDEMKAWAMGVVDFPPPRFSLPSAEEALATGRLSLIRSPAVRDSVRAVADEMAFINRQWQRYSRVKHDIEQPFYGAAGLALKGGLATVPGTVWWGEDLDQYQFRTPEGVCGNSDMVALVSNVAITQSIYVDYLDEVAVRLEAYRASLADGAGRGAGAPAHSEGGP
ncbi:hypothetical protein [Rubrivirga sp. IMCC45206]|uniref:hypothetical protein n=1 Tax=Rubrivirga sp. IMCC45206 TaxID=3391614 RepID=UPI00398FC348